MKLRRYSFVALLAFIACIEPFHVKIPDGERFIVVDGMISNQPGPYHVTIYRAAALNNPYDKTEWISQATITLFDDEGNSEVLSEPTPGHYQTATTLGTIGRTYFIRIVTSSGVTYESTPEKILPMGDFSNLSYDFQLNEAYENENQSKPKNGFEVYLDAELDPEQEGLVRWRYTGIFEARTYPERRLKALPGPIIKFIPDPPLCSGWVVSRSNINVIEQIGECTCCFCWVSQYNDAPLLSDERFVKNNQVKQLNVAFIPANKRYFYDKYYLEVEQMSLSQATYNFWKRVGQQQSQGSSLFQTPAAVTGGNIKLITEGGQPAIGLFAAHGIQKHSFILKPEDIPYRVMPVDSVDQSCLIVDPYTSNEKPPFW